LPSLFKSDTSTARLRAEWPDQVNNGRRWSALRLRLIDTYNALTRGGMGPREASLRTGAQRLRPVVLTSVMTALGLMPMVIGLNIDFVTRKPRRRGPRP